MSITRFSRCLIFAKCVIALVVVVVRVVGVVDIIFEFVQHLNLRWRVGVANASLTDWQFACWCERLIKKKYGYGVVTGMIICLLRRRSGWLYWSPRLSCQRVWDRFGHSSPFLWLVSLSADGSNCCSFRSCRCCWWCWWVCLAFPLHVIDRWIVLESTSCFLSQRQCVSCRYVGVQCDETKFRTSSACIIGSSYTWHFAQTPFLHESKLDYMLN